MRCAFLRFGQQRFDSAPQRSRRIVTRQAEPGARERECPARHTQRVRHTQIPARLNELVRVYRWNSCYAETSLEGSSQTHQHAHVIIAQCTARTTRQLRHSQITSRQLPRCRGRTALLAYTTHRRSDKSHWQTRGCVLANRLEPQHVGAICGAKELEQRSRVRTCDAYPCECGRDRHRLENLRIYLVYKFVQT